MKTHSAALVLYLSLALWTPTVVTAGTGSSWGTEYTVEAEMEIRSEMETNNPRLARPLEDPPDPIDHPGFPRPTTPHLVITTPPLAVTSTASSTSTTSATSTTPPPTTPTQTPHTPLPSNLTPCLSTPACTTILDDLTKCYATSGLISDPSDPHGQSHTYRTCLCGTLGQQYKLILAHHLVASADAPQACLACFVRGGASESAPRGVVQRFLRAVHGFCNSRDPNLYLFLSAVVRVWRDAGAQGSAEGSGIWGVTTWEGRFTSREGMNVPTPFVASTLAVGGPVASTKTVEGSATGGPEGGAGDGGGGSVRTFPTGLMTQVPSGWPYTKYGVGRRRETTTWALTRTRAEGSRTAGEETVGLVKAVVSWFPRPVFQGAGTRLGLGSAADGEVRKRAVEQEEDVGVPINVTALGELWDEIQTLQRIWTGQNGP